MTQPMLKGTTRKHETGTTDDELEWVKRFGNALYNLTCDRIESEEHNDFIIKSNYSVLVGCLAWAIEQHLDAIPSELKPILQILDDDIIRKENLEKS